MAIEAGGKILREGSAAKRADILAAARDLFRIEGFDRTSVDAISARAGVSKRTVYDYFGDKQALLIAVIDGLGESLMAAIRAAIDDDLTEFDDLEDALVSFSTRIVSSTMGSSDYATLIQLVTKEVQQLPGATIDDWFDTAPEDAIAERFVEFGRRGLLEVPNPRLAADHFVALAFLGVTNGAKSSQPLDEAAARQSVLDGVRAFLRAYAPR
ncbi:MAG TPA: TetR family transcriptional regulator [Galbitalea sp.]